jgi:alcohol dehydrogenase
MLAVHFENGRVELRRAARPRRPKGFALIRVLAAGICNTDLELLAGYYGFRGRPGHEFVGEVLEAEDPALLGRRVVGEINLACGRCDWCAAGRERHCPRRKVLGIVAHPGAFAELLTLPEKNLHLVPDSLPNEHAVFVEPVAAACEILEQVRIPHGAPVAVLGDGKLGLLVAQVLAAHGLTVHLYGKHREKLRLAEAAGIRTVLVGNKTPVAAYDWVIEATGAASGLAAAVGLTRPRGTVILKSTVHERLPFDTAPVVVNELTLVGSRCGPFEPALRLLVEGAVRVDGLISAIYPLSEAPAALRRAAERGALKVLLVPD